VAHQPDGRLTSWVDDAPTTDPAPLPAQSDTPEPMAPDTQDTPEPVAPDAADTA
jgi:hypothetical protein